MVREEFVEEKMRLAYESSKKLQERAHWTKLHAAHIQELGNMFARAESEGRREVADAIGVVIDYLVELESPVE